MRIPNGKIYRAFPELDRFSDDACARFMVRARIRRGLRAWLPRLSVIATFPLGVVSYFLLLACFGGWIERVMDASDEWMYSKFNTRVMLPELVFTIILVLWIAGFPAMVCVLWRDRQLRSALRDSIDAAVCASCDHSLLGLPLLADEPHPAVRCPECGAVMELAAIGLTPEDLIAGERERAEDAGGGA